MTRRGFALLTVLWLIAGLSLAVGVTFSVAHLGTWETRNRVALTRASWAREACHEVLLARFATDHSVRLVDTVDLGWDTWCRAELENASAKLDVNAMAPEAWQAILGNDTLADAVLDWRDADDVTRPLGSERAWYGTNGLRLPRNGALASVAELRFVRGFDSARMMRLQDILTTRGTQQVDFNAVPLEVLSILPGVTPEVIEVVRSDRAAGHRIRSAEELLALLSPPAREAMWERYQEFSRIVVFEPVRFVELVEGGVRGTGLVSRGWLTVVPTTTRLAVIRREME